MRRANRLGGGYQPIQKEHKEKPEEGETDHGLVDTEEQSIILRGDNLPIVDWRKYRVRIHARLEYANLEKGNRSGTI